MSWTLFKADIKANRLVWSIMTIVMCFYMLIIVTMFDPESADAMNEMLELMPESLLKAMGFEQFGTTLITFITNYIYGFLILLFPMVYSIIVNHRLIASHIDKGSMSFIASTPNSRLRISLTQAMFSLVSISIMFIIITIFTIIISISIHPNLLDINKFILVNIYALLMYYSISGIGFFSSCIAQESRHSLSIGVGLPVLFLVLQMIGNIGDKFKWVGNLSLYTLFNANKMIKGDSFIYIGASSFIIIATLLYAGGIFVFNRRDLNV